MLQCIQPSPSAPKLSVLGPQGMSFIQDFSRLAFIGGGPVLTKMLGISDLVAVAFYARAVVLSMTSLRIRLASVLHAHNVNVDM